MATGDITSVTIRADGWTADVVVEGFTTGATYAFGLAANNTSGASTPYLTVVSEGYNSSGVLGTTTRTVYMTQVVRKAYPNHASLNETGGGNLTVRVALSDYVYDDDNTGAGKSGTAPTFTAPVGWITNTGGASQTSAAASAMAVTNSSTVDYPKVIGHFAIEDRRPVNGTHDIEVFAVHKYGKNKTPVARVAVSATGGTSSVIASGAATAMTASGRGDGIPVYAVPLNLSTGASFTRGELVTINFTAYPWVGDADSVLDSTVDAGDKIFKLNPLKWTIMSKMIAVVDPVGGNDGTGAASLVQATADGAAFQTLGAAIAGLAAQNNSTYTLNRIDGGEVQLKAGSYSWNGSASGTSTNGYFTICPHSSTNRAGVVFDNYTSSRSQKKYQRFYNVTFTRGSSIYIIFAAATNVLVMESVNFTDTYNPWYSGDANSSIDFLDCVYTNGYFSPSGNDQMVRLHRNCSYTATSNTSNYAAGNAACVLGLEATGAAYNLWNPVATAGTNNYVFAFIRSLNTTRGLASITVSYTNTAFVGNLIERVGADPSVILEVSATDGGTMSNIVLFHNTFAGQRFNHENDISAAYVNGTAVNFSARFNSFNARGDHRADVFDSDASMIGTWSIGYSVGWSDNHNEADSYSGDTDFWGLRSNTDTGTSISPAETAGYVDDKSTSSFGDDAGNGNYFPDTGSVLLARIPSGHAVIPFDQDGTVYRNDGTDAIGAFDSFVAPTVTTTTPSGVTTTAATLGGNVTSDGGATVTERGVCYNTTGTPTTSDTKNTNGTGTGVFSEQSTGLTPGTLYYVRAYAINSVGTSYGSQQTFTTDEDGAPIEDATVNLSRAVTIAALPLSFSGWFCMNAEHIGYGAIISLEQGSKYIQIGIDGTTIVLKGSDGSTTYTINGPTISAGAWVSIRATITSASWTLDVDANTYSASNPIADFSIAPTILYLGRDAAENVALGYIREVGVWRAALSTASRSQLRSDVPFIVEYRNLVSYHSLKAAWHGLYDHVGHIPMVGLIEWTAVEFRRLKAPRYLL